MRKPPLLIAVLFLGLWASVAWCASAKAATPPATYSLTVVRLGTDLGRIESQPFGNDFGIWCDSVCTSKFPANSLVILTESLLYSHSIFLGWDGGYCTGTGDCVIVLAADTTVTATFGPASALMVTDAGTGAGTVTSAPAGITCGTGCYYHFANGSPVTLTATAAQGSVFAGWNGGGCSGTSTCTVTLGADTSVTATFMPTYTLSVTKSGTGAGTVTSVPAGIACGATCSAGFTAGTSVILIATANPGSVFVGWGGACSGTSTCTVPGTANAAVTATFMPTSVLTVSKVGTGAGVVTTSPSGISCGATCATPFLTGSAVTPTATAAQGSVFAGWNGGGCSGTSTCTVTLGADTTVTANFSLLPTTSMLSITKTGTGTGTVASNASGIACGTTCNASFGLNSVVTLTAAPAAGSTFVGWSGGACNGVAPCAVLLNQTTVVNADFVANSSSDIILVSALLPTSRSVQVGTPATVFGTMINASPDTAGNDCMVTPTTNIPATFFFQSTDPATNALSGTTNTPVTIAPGAAQSFVLAFTPLSAFAPTNVAFSFTCTNSTPATSSLGLNTLLLSGSTTPAPDVIVLAATATNDGIVDIPGVNGTGAFAVATANVGAAGAITASANDGVANLPVVIMICETNPSTGQCINPATPGSSATTTIGAGATPTFAIFIQGTGSVPFQPAVNRIFVQFQDAVPAGTVRGSASVAVRTQ